MADGDLAPLTPAAFQVLLALARGDAHGYGIMGFVHDVTRGSARLSPGTLYRTLGKLAEDGLVEEAPGTHEDHPHDSRRRYYRLTQTGRSTAAHEAARLDRLVTEAGRAGLLDLHEVSPA